MKFLKLFVLVAAIAAAAGGLAWYWHQGTIYPSTDDAYVEANILTISPQVMARVTRVAATEGARVEAGDVLVEFDDSALKAEVDAAQAQLDLAIQSAGANASNVSAAEAALAAAKAALDDADSTLTRTQALYDKGDVAKAALDSAQTARDRAAAGVSQAQAALQAARDQSGAKGADNAAVRAARASLTQAEIALGHATIKAPVAGWIANISLRPGDVVSPGEALFALVEDGHWWLAANFQETDLARLRPGQPVDVSLDMYPDQSLTGTVDTIGAGSGAVFALLPPQNATGNWVKVTQRFPVQITLDRPADPALRLRVGASATATVDTTGLEAPGS